MVNTNQVYQIVNEAAKVALGESTLIAEDWSNLVATGNKIFDAEAVDVYSKALVNRIGQTVYVDRAYKGQLPKMLYDGSEMGSALQKVSAGLPVARVNESYELADGQSYDPHVFRKPKDVATKYYNEYLTFAVDLSYTETQLKDSFISKEEMSRFISMLFTQVENSINFRIEQCALRTLDSAIIDTVYDDYGSTDLAANSGVKAINLLRLYNDANGTKLTAGEGLLTNADFVRFASYTIKKTHDRLKSMNCKFNIGKQPRHTPSEDCFITLLTDFKSASDVYLQSQTFHNELSALPESQSVAYWQGIDKPNDSPAWTFDAVSTVTGTSGNGNTATVTGVLGVMYDRWACGVFNMGKKVTSEYTANAEFFTNFYKYRAMNFVDSNENFVVFFVA